MDIENRQGVVYLLECDECFQSGKKESYVGETGRILKKRLRDLASTSPN